MSDQKKALRKKTEILETLPRIISKSDKKFVSELFTCSGVLVKNGYQKEDNPASYVGWARIESGDIIRLEAEQREGEGGKIILALKVITIPELEAVEMGLAEPAIPNYKSEKTKSFLDQ